MLYNGVEWCIGTMIAQDHLFGHCLTKIVLMQPDAALPSLVSLASSHGGFDSLPNGVRPSFRRKSLVDRKISVSSIMSDDSMDFMEEAGRAVGSAVGFSRMNSTPL